MLAITHVPYDGVLGDLSDELQTMTMNEIRVQCYSGFKADERPQKFTLRGRDFIVQEVDDQWYSPAAVYFRVLADDGNITFCATTKSRTRGRWTRFEPRVRGIVFPVRLVLHSSSALVTATPTAQLCTPLGVNINCGAKVTPSAAPERCWSVCDEKEPSE